VNIDNEWYCKNEPEKILTKLLKRSNYYREKDSNNNTMLKAKSGKLSHTNSLSVAEFQAKYNL